MVDEEVDEVAKKTVLDDGSSILEAEQLNDVMEQAEERLFERIAVRGSTTADLERDQLQLAVAHLLPGLPTLSTTDDEPPASLPSTAPSTPKCASVVSEIPRGVVDPFNSGLFLGRRADPPTTRGQPLPSPVPLAAEAGAGNGPEDLPGATAAKAKAKGKGKAKAKATPAKGKAKGAGRGGSGRGAGADAGVDSGALGDLEKPKGGRVKRDLTPAAIVMIDEFSTTTETSSYFHGKDSRNSRRQIERMLADLTTAVNQAGVDDQNEVLITCMKSLHFMFEIVKIAKVPGFRTAEFLKVYDDNAAYVRLPPLARNPLPQFMLEIRFSAKVAHSSTVDFWGLLVPGELANFGFVDHSTAQARFVKEKIAALTQLDAPDEVPAHAILTHHTTRYTTTTTTATATIVTTTTATATITGSTTPPPPPPSPRCPGRAHHNNQH
jgi:hypothetical protein